jgi:hypothetical protein
MARLKTFAAKAAPTGAAVFCRSGFSREGNGEAQDIRG